MRHVDVSIAKYKAKLHGHAISPKKERQRQAVWAISVFFLVASNYSFALRSMSLRD